jgi:phosphomannomutase
MMIHFGTDGWRGLIAEDFTFANLRLVAAALADYIVERGEAQQGLVVGYDARFLSREFASACAAVLSAKGLAVWLSAEVLSTPALTWQVMDRKTAGGVMITASHNPPAYNGFKFKATYGGSASPEIVAAIEVYVHKLEAAGCSVPLTELSEAVQLYAPQEAYLRHVRDMLDAKVLTGFTGKILFDVMHGSAMGYPAKLAATYGLDLAELHGDVNPSFGGVNPEPIAKNLTVLREAMLEQQAFIGLATDGDGDRIGAMDADGRFVNSHQIIALLIKYLVEKRGWTGGVAKTVTVSELVSRVAGKYHLPIYETKVGFKYLADLMIHDDILIGGEESGGIGLKGYIPERDGLLLGFMLIEMVAAYGQTLGQLLDELTAELGYLAYAREDLHLLAPQKERLVQRLAEATPTVLGPWQVLSVNKVDGCKLILANGAWVMFRASGTEPIVRVYVEASSDAAVNEIMKEAVTYAQAK